MLSINRIFPQLLVCCVCIYCLLYFTADGGMRPSFSLGNLQCVRRKHQNSKFHEGVHYPNQLYYEYIINKNPREFIIMAPKISRSTEAIIMVLSKNTEEKVREEIRQTWGHPSNPYLKDGSARLIFLVGDNHEDLGCLAEENKLYQDILMVRVLDSYRGLVYKLLMAYQYISAEYPNAVLIKIDRDCILDISPMMTWLRNVTEMEENFIYGYIFFGAPPVRDMKSQWYVPEPVFNGSWYPWYVNGNFYIVSPASLQTMMNYTREVKVVEIEDLFFTGILRQEANHSKPLWLHEYKLPSPNYSYCPTHLQRRMFAHGGVGDKMTERYKNFLEWKVRDCDSDQAELDEKEREKKRKEERKNKKKKEEEAAKKKAADVVYSKKLSDSKKKMQ